MVNCCAMKPPLRESETVEFFNAEGVCEGGCVLRHLFNRSRNFAAGAGVAGVVKQNHFAVLGKSVDQGWIPVIHCSREVHEEEQRDVDLCAEATVREANAGGLNELGRRGLVTVTAHETSIDEIYAKRELSARELSAVGSE
jgi:hypothetical protein